MNLTRAAAALVLTLVAACAPSTPPGPSSAIEGIAGDAGADALPAAGRLRVSLFGGAGSDAVVRHRSTWVRGVGGYDGCDANDLRGHLDGTFKWGWNQSSQVHVRVGRRDGGARYGEYELFRVLLRWADVRLPHGAAVESARLELTVEEGPDRAVGVLLYEVHGDWRPGGGGTAEDNVSPPRPGEVWWRDRAHGEAPWGLPGVGYAADGDPAADTPATALAAATWRPGDALLTFESPALAAAIERRIAAGRPLGFLIKLDDWSEDRPGLLVAFYSPRHGASTAPGTRPRLEVTWSAPGRAAIDRDVVLEYGRRLPLGPLPVGGATFVVAEFEPDEGGSIEPAILDADGRALPAHPVAAPPGSGPVDLTVLAARRPVELGATFVAEIRDTWIRSAPPEEQRVRWVFVAPSGAVHERDARFVGDWTWRVEFEPDEPGPWRYRFSQRFVDDQPYDSLPAAFDVVAADAAAMTAAVAAFAERLAALTEGERRERVDELMRTFLHLQRAAVSRHTAASFAGPEGAALRAALDDARERLGGRPPAEIPLEPSPAPEWRKDAEVAR